MIHLRQVPGTVYRRNQRTAVFANRLEYARSSMSNSIVLLRARCTTRCAVSTSANKNRRPPTQQPWGGVCVVLGRVVNPEIDMFLTQRPWLCRVANDSEITALVFSFLFSFVSS